MWQRAADKTKKRKVVKNEPTRAYFGKEMERNVSRANPVVERNYLRNLYIKKMFN